MPPSVCHRLCRQVYYTGFRRLMQRPALQEAMVGAARDGLDFIMLGSNVGTELFYAALTYGPQRRGRVLGVRWSADCTRCDVWRHAGAPCGGSLGMASRDTVVVLMS